MNPSRYAARSRKQAAFAPPTINDIEAALQHIDSNIPRDDWATIGMALKSELGEGGFELFDAWSETGSTYKPDDAKSTWRSIKPTGGIGIGTLFHKAKEGGWSPESRRTVVDVMEAEKARRERQQQREADERKAAGVKRQDQEAVALTAFDRWHAAEPADPEHAYLKAKGIAGTGIKQEGENLLVPLYDEHGGLWSLQTISPTGEKRFAKGSRKSGCFLLLPGATDKVIICEGYATGVSIHEATGCEVVVAIDAGNLVPVAEIIRKRQPDAAIVIAADNDEAGISKGTQAAEAVDGLLVKPETLGQDFNDAPEEIQAAVDGADIPKYPYILFNEVTPELDTTALVQGLMKPESFIVTYGESGSGKTFEALYRDLCIASGKPYFGRETEQGLVVYLAAEGGHSTRNRVAAYRRELFPKADFALVPHSMDLLNANGDVAGLINLIKHLEDILGKSCVKVTQDTLARALMGGNENSGEDMGLLVSNADHIRHTVGCVFEFIHHSGKDAARGARGHSSLKAATDTELEVTANCGLHHMTPTKQRDYSLGDIFTFKLNQVEIGIDQKGEPVTTCIPEEMEGEYLKSGNKRPTAGEQLAIQTLEEAMKLHQRMPPSDVLNNPVNRLNGSRNVCPLSEWRQIYVARKVNDRTKPDSAERSFRRYAESLQVKEIIKVYEGWVWFLKG